MRSAPIILLLDDSRFGHCIWEHIYDQAAIRPYFDFDYNYHSSNKNDITWTFATVQTNSTMVCSKIAKKKQLDLAIPKIYKHTMKNGKVIPICDGLQMSPLGLYHFVHDNGQFMNELGVDLVLNTNLKFEFTQNW